MYKLVSVKFINRLVDLIYIIYIHVYKLCSKLIPYREDYLIIYHTVSKYHIKYENCSRISLRNHKNQPTNIAKI